MQCRAGCGACCTVPSISSAMPGLPLGKPAGVACPHLLDDARCGLFGDPRRPTVCARLQPGFDMCGTDPGDAFARLRALDEATRPDGGQT